MIHSLFRKEFFVETAFERRFQAMLRLAWQHRSWHVIVADPGAGKTMGIRDLVKAAGSRTILAVTAPKNNEDEMALGNQFFGALGVSIKGRWSDRKPKLMGHLYQYGTECLIVDDAHDLSFKHLMFPKELTDQGRLQYDHPLGLCLVAAARGSVIPLKETLDQPETTWLQWRRRLDKEQPFCRVTSHTSEEVREILASLETVYQELIPQLNLRRWSSSIYSWLTQPVLDPANSGCVTMDYLMKLVTIALEWTYQKGEADVQAETLEQAASLLVLRKDTLRIIDGAGPSLAGLVRVPGPGQANETQAVQIFPQNGEQQTLPSSPTEQATVAQPKSREKDEPNQSAKCTFSGVVPIDIKRFEENGVSHVECPGCGRTWSLAPHSGVLRFKSHDKRKTNTPNTGRRWARGEKETDWDVIGS